MLINSDYQTAFGFSNKHVQTIFPALFRKVKTTRYVRERLSTPDDDFLLLDWIKNDQEALVILSHGLEGDSQSYYMRGMANHLSENGYDICAWNYRGCGGEVNQQLKFYHSGFTEDLNTVVERSAKDYQKIYLLGFSVGGNITLKYLGEKGDHLSKKVVGAAVFSVPVDLKSCSHHLDQLSNRIYRTRFMKKLKAKIQAKERQFPAQISSKGFEQLKTLSDFDNRYTASIYGFEDADDYYRKCSSKSWISSIRRRCLIVNAQNDPFLPKACYPVEECKEHELVDLEMPEQGGHLGFIERGGVYWLEDRALKYFESL